MDDLERGRLCAEAMGIEIIGPLTGADGIQLFNGQRYDPFHDDAQAMALVRKLQLNVTATLDLRSRVTRTEPADGWMVESSPWGCIYRTHNTDLNRAIVECVALMMNARKREPLASET